MNQFIIVSIIMYGLMHNAKSNNDCNGSSSKSEQCVCVEPQNHMNYLSTCEELINNRIICRTELKEDMFIEIELPNLLTCNNTSFQIKLLVNEVLDSDTCNQNGTAVLCETELSANWNKHSEIKYTIHKIHECSSSRHLNCRISKNTVPAVTFDYIYSGCYILKIYGEGIFHKSECLYACQPTFILSNYTKSRLVDDNVIDIQTRQLRESQEYEIVIRMNSTYMMNPPSIKTTLMTRDCNQDCIILTAVTNIHCKNNMDHHVIDYNKTFTRCSDVLNITWNCTYAELKDTSKWIQYICKYIGLPPGRYTYGYSLLGENTRCNVDSVWAEPGNACVSWMDVDVPEYRQTNETKNINETPEILRPEYIVISLLIITILICLCIFLYIKYCKLKHQPQVTLEQSCQYLPGEELTLLNTKEILIIYARDCELFDTMMDSFKQLLLSVDNNVFVHDINVHNETMCIDPENWIRSKISTTNMKIILFLNRCGSLIFENLIGENPSTISYRNEKWQDSIFPYAVKQLEKSKTISYKNLFVVVASVCNTSVFDHINPDTRFVIPNSVDMLLKQVFPNITHLNTPLHFIDCCYAYNKYCEDNLDYITDILKM